VETHAVIFDLWDTLVDWPLEDSIVFERRLADQLGVSVEAFRVVWREEAAHRARQVGPLGPNLSNVCEALGSDADVEELLSWRREFTRRSLVPRLGALETLAALRERGIRTGLISNCSEDVPDVWESSDLAPLFDVAVFSATAGCMKPDREIYELACARLHVAPTGCLFVGDGANNELRGAEAMGMTPVLIHRYGQEPVWADLRDWDGHRVTSIPDVLELVA
jgi:putative hydrolase of the HAD superfamily